MEVNASVAPAEEHLWGEVNPLGGPQRSETQGGKRRGTQRDKLAKKLNAAQVLPEGREPISVN